MIKALRRGVLYPCQTRKGLPLPGMTLLGIMPVKGIKHIQKDNPCQVVFCLNGLWIKTDNAARKWTSLFSCRWLVFLQADT